MAEDEKTTLGQVVVLNNPESPLQQAAEALAETPMVDAAKVRELRRLLAEGGYEVDPAQIAERLLALDQRLPELTDTEGSASLHQGTAPDPNEAPPQ